MKAVNATGVRKVCLAGGVSANSFLRRAFDEASSAHDIELYYPKLRLCTDNAAMIASAGYFEYINGRRDDLSLNAVPSLKL